MPAVTTVDAEEQREARSGKYRLRSVPKSCLKFNLFRSVWLKSFTSMIKGWQFNFILFQISFKFLFRVTTEFYAHLIDWQWPIS